MKRLTRRLPWQPLLGSHLLSLVANNADEILIDEEDESETGDL